MKLLLTSAGLSNEIIAEEFRKLLDKPMEQVKVIFIPTASRTEEERYYVNISKQELIDLGIIEIKVLDIDHEITYDEIKDYDVLYVCGGNTFYLLDQIRKFNFDKLIKRFIEEDKLYLGVSAGTYITCPTIEHASWDYPDKNDVGLDDLTGLNLIPFLLTAHYEPDIKDVTKEEISKTKYKTRILTDQQALVVTDEIRFIGKGEEVKL